MSRVIEQCRNRYVSSVLETMTLREYLDLCARDKMAYASVHARLLAAIGEPEVVDTHNDPRLSRIFQNRVIRRYPAFAGFYGMEDVINQIVSYLTHAAQGLEERKQILYLLGPAGGGKSSLADRLKELMQRVPFYALKGSPVFESPLGFFSPERDGLSLEDEYGIPRTSLYSIMSPWAVKRLREYGGDVTKFEVVKLCPSVLEQIAIAKTEPGDENNQDISALVGKVDIRMLERYAQNDPDAYSYSGALCRANQGLMEFVEMFKAPLKVLHPLLTATQEGNYNGTEGISALPFTGIVLAHSNEAEWQTFRNSTSNEAFLDRVCMVRVPYCLRATEERQIYEKLLRDSTLANAPCAPRTLDLLADWVVCTRLKEPEGGTSLLAKLHVYDGRRLERESGKRGRNVPSIGDYRDEAGIDEGMEGVSTRAAFKLISVVFNMDTEEVAADPVRLFAAIEQFLAREHLMPEVRDRYLMYLKQYIAPPYIAFLGEELRRAYLESYAEQGQDLFDRYVLYADHWVQDVQYCDPETGDVFTRANLNAELEKVEKPAGISNPKEFRNEIVQYVLRERPKYGGTNPAWNAHDRFRSIFEKKIFATMKEVLPIVSFGQHATEEEQRRHDGFVERMVERGYASSRQVRRLTEWYIRVRQAM